MKRSSGSLKPYAAVLALAMLLVSCRSRPASLETRSGELTLRAALSPDPPRQKGNALDLEILDASGRAVENAELQVEASMAGMAWVPGMRSRAEVEKVGGGRYRARFDVGMGGTWQLDVSVTSAAGKGAAAYSFTPGVKGLEARDAAAPAAVAKPQDASSSAARAQFPEPALSALQAALVDYEEARAALARDRVADVASAARRVAESLRQARAAFGAAEPNVCSCLDEGAAAAERLAAAGDLAAARVAFGDLSRFLIAASGMDARLTEGRHLFTCSMTTESFNLWIQPAAAAENPYLGTEMSTCGDETPWGGVSAALANAPAGQPAAQAAIAAPGAIDHYSCSMHTNVRSDRPGKCPICSMDLVPVTVAEVQTGEIVVDEARRQTIGVRTSPVVSRRLEVEIRAAGKVAYDETRWHEVSVKYAGWIGDLRVDSTGQEVRRGQTLFTLYSPELYAAQQEFLTALRSQRAAQATSAPERADYLVEAARQRLRLWDLAEAEIAEIARRGEPRKDLPIPSPVAGTVIEKMVVAGAAVEPGMKLYRIAGLDRVWVEADVAESDLGEVRVGQQAVIRLASLPGREFTGKVAFLYPYLDASTRTGRVRVELENPQRELRPDMYAEVTLRADRGERLVVPQSAVLFAGERRLVFLDLGGGRLRPQTVEVGVKSGDDLEVLSGLHEGDVVVSSGTFVVAAESRLKSATGQWQ
jgi:Cu(I)/Ag(I) efflux system membrane fusion protein